MNQDEKDAEICRLREELAGYRARFGEVAASAGVPVAVVADAAAHTFDMLDAEQQVELIEQAMSRWSAHQHMKGATGVVVASQPGQMAADLVYRLQHERFDLVYAIAVRLTDAPEGPENAQWLMTPARPGEPETPVARVIVVMDGLCQNLRRARQQFETVTLMQKAKARKAGLG